MKTEEEITKDRQDRVIKAKAEIEAVLDKYELSLVAEDMIGERTKISLMLNFVDTKKYPDAIMAQEVNPILDDMLNSPNTPITKKK